MNLRKFIPYIFVACLAIPLCSSAKVDLDKYHREILELSVDENLHSPDVPTKQMIGAQSAISVLSTRLSRLGYNTDLSERDGLVCMVTVPVSQLFNANDTILSHTAPDRLKALVHPLRNPDKYKMLIVVHSDDTGSEEYRNNLTRARADAIRCWIADLGIPVDGVVPYGLGYDEPVNVETSRKGRASNRRVEFYFVPGPLMIEELKAGRR